SDIVHAGREVGKKVADPFSTLAVLLELPLGSDDGAFVLFAAASEGLHGNALAVQRVKLRLVIKRVHLARPAIHEQENDAFGPGRKLRRLCRQRIRKLLSRRGGISLAGKKLVERLQARERQSGEAGAGFPEKLA